jgi:drug/metabolite transporter (DMT)-like permease
LIRPRVRPAFSSDPLLRILPTTVALLAFIFCCVVWGSSFILLERVTHVFAPVEIGIWRMLSGAAVVGLFWLLRRGEFRLQRRDWLYMLLAAVAFTAPPQVVQSYVLAQGYGHSFFGTMVAAIPLLTVLVSIPMLGVVPTSRELVGVLGGLACMWLLVEDGVHRGMSWGLLALTFIVPLSSALSNTFIKWKLPHVQAAPLTTILLVAASFALLPLQLSTPALETLHIAGPANATVTPLAVVYLLILGIVASGVSTMVFIWMILEKGPLYAGMTTYVVPVMALLWGSVDQEIVSSRQMLAIAGVLAMVALVQTGSRRVAASAEFEPNDFSAEPHLAVVPTPELAAPTSLVSTPESQVA